MSRYREILAFLRDRVPSEFGTNGRIMTQSMRDCINFSTRIAKFYWYSWQTWIDCQQHRQITKTVQKHDLFLSTTKKNSISMVALVVAITSADLCSSYSAVEGTICSWYNNSDIVMLGCQHLLFTSYKILLDLYFTSSSEANHSSNESPVLIQLKSAILLQSCANPFLSTMLWTTICNIMHSFRCMGRIFTTKSSGFVHVCMPQCRCSLGDVFVFKLPTYCAIPPSPP